MGLLDSRLHRKQHQASGERLRWQKAIPVPPGTAGRLSDGVRLEEQTIDPAARFLVSSTSEDYEAKPFGLIRKGTMQLSAFPDWARFNHLDRIILTAWGRTLSSIAKTITRGETEDDVLPMPYIASVTNIWIGGEAVDRETYEATPTGIHWLTEDIEPGTVYSAEYLHHPRYIVLPQTHRTSPTDRNGISLPLHYWLHRESNTGS